MLCVSIILSVFLSFFFFFSSRRRHTRWPRDWSSDVCSSDLGWDDAVGAQAFGGWDFFRFRDLTVAGEAGVFTSGSFSHDHPAVRSDSIEGLYVNALAKYPLTDSLWVQGRAGTNFSDTGGGMIGGGIGLRVTPAVSVRFEAARYGDVTSLFRVDAVVTF